ncbi:hypothetical protein [Amycolatopsis benzoatilytica]|uniref:hypothetical protein n=1 Tax=Amycolatopsis benzoatilytica TaxID=346045 RepID=UPI0003723431|nr:hypothetical protein [Amycolatopsis benzoatilytica]
MNAVEKESAQCAAVPLSFRTAPLTGRWPGEVCCTQPAFAPPGALDACGILGRLKAIPLLTAWSRAASEDAERVGGRGGFGRSGGFAAADRERRTGKNVESK